MSVTVSAYNQLTQLVLNKGIDLNNICIELLSNSASFTATHTKKHQVDNGSFASGVTFNTSTDVVTDTAHGLTNGTPVAFVVSAGGALPGGLTAGVYVYVIGATTNTYQVSLTSGGSAIDLTGAASGTVTRNASGSYETYGNGLSPGGFLLASVAVNAAAINDATVNDAILTATNPVTTASGGSLPPAAAFNAVAYDRTTMNVLEFVSFGQSQQAGITTDFKILINANGLLNLQV